MRKEASMKQLCKCYDLRIIYPSCGREGFPPLMLEKFPRRELFWVVKPSLRSACPSKVARALRGRPQTQVVLLCISPS